MQLFKKSKYIHFLPYQYKIVLFWLVSLAALKPREPTQLSLPAFINLMRVAYGLWA